MTNSTRRKKSDPKKSLEKKTPRDKAGQAEKHVHNHAVLITGASGFIGRPLTKKLAEGGHTVVSMYRHAIPEALQNIYPVCSNLSNVDLLAVPLRGVDTVIHLAWDNSFLSTSDSSSESSSSLSTSHERLGGSSLAESVKHSEKYDNLSCLKNLIAAMEQSQAKRLIFLSAIGSHRKSKHRFLREKFIAEGLVINSQIEEKIVIRTSLVYGGDGGNKDPFVKSIRDLLSYPAITPIPYPKLALRPTHIDDLLSYMMECVTEKQGSGSRLIDLCGDEEITTEELVKLCLQREDQGAKIPIKGSIGQSLLYLLEKSTSHPSSQPSIRQYLSVEYESQNRDKRHDGRYQKVRPKLRSLRDCFGR